MDYEELPWPTNSAYTRCHLTIKQNLIRQIISCHNYIHMKCAFISTCWHWEMVLFTQLTWKSASVDLHNYSGLPVQMPASLSSMNCCDYCNVSKTVIVDAIVNISIVPSEKAVCLLSNKMSLSFVQPLRPSLKKSETGQDPRSVSESMSASGDGRTSIRDRRAKFGRQTSLSQSIRR